jgi:hypothetical protein
MGLLHQRVDDGLCADMRASREAKGQAPAQAIIHHTTRNPDINAHRPSSGSEPNREFTLTE